MVLRTASLRLSRCMSAQDARGPEEHENTRHWNGVLPAMPYTKVSNRFGLRTRMASISSSL